MRVPYSDLSAEYQSMKTEIDEAIQNVIDSTAFSGGHYVDIFEDEFAKYCDCQSMSAVGSGTEALWLSLLALGIGEGDEVITVPNTFVATIEAIQLTGAKPVLVDVDERTYTINPQLIRAAITPRTKAIIPVHLYGQMADMDAVCKIANDYGLKVVEDACQAHGAKWRGRRAGSFGDAGCFSFYPGKNLGAYGEAGGVTTNNRELDERIRLLRNHGQSEKYIHTAPGWNARMDGIQGAILSVKLKKLDSRNAARIRNAEFYNNCFREINNVTVPSRSSDAVHIYHVYCIQVKERDKVLLELMNTGIECAIHYPLPVHLQKAYKDLGYSAGDFPVSEICASQYLSLPAHPDLSPEQVLYVSEQFARVLNSTSHKENFVESHSTIK